MEEVNLMGDFNYVPLAREGVEVLKDIRDALKGIREELEKHNEQLKELPLYPLHVKVTDE